MVTTLGGQGPLQVTSAACSTKEMIPKGLPEPPARPPIRPGNEVLSVVLWHLSAGSLIETAPKPVQRNADM